VAEYNEATKPFVWNADPDRIIAVVKRRHQKLDPNRLDRPYAPRCGQATTSSTNC
jgi:hypothetical protein